MLCPVCQTEIELCPCCGASLPETSSSRRAEAARLVFDNPADSPQTAFLLSQDNNLIGRRDPHKGRFPEIDLTPFDPECRVSRCHARIYSQGEQFFVEDLESCNGTYLMAEGKEVRVRPGEPRPIHDGSGIRFGNVTGNFFSSGNE